MSFGPVEGPVWELEIAVAATGERNPLSSGGRGFGLLTSGGDGGGEGGGEECGGDQRGEHGCEEERVGLGMGCERRKENCGRRGCTKGSSQCALGEGSERKHGGEGVRGARDRVVLDVWRASPSDLWWGAWREDKQEQRKPFRSRKVERKGRNAATHAWGNRAGCARTMKQL